MSTFQTFKVTLTLIENNDTENPKSIPVTSLTMQASLGQMFPTASATVSHKDYVFLANYAASASVIPYAILAVDVTGIPYTQQVLLIGFSGNEGPSGITNTITLAPYCYYANILTSSWSMINNVGNKYLSNVPLLLKDVTAHFNTNVFKSLIPSLVMLDPMASITTNVLTIAPRFIGMTYAGVLSQIAGIYGLDVVFTWGNQVFLTSLVNPADSGVTINSDMIQDNNYRADMQTAIFGRLGWSL